MKKLTSFQKEKKRSRKFEMKITIKHNNITEGRDAGKERIRKLHFKC